MISEVVRRLAVVFALPFDSMRESRHILFDDVR